MLRAMRQPFGGIGGSSRLGLGLAIVLALLTGVLIYAWMAANDSRNAPAGVTAAPMVTVVTAATNIAAGTTITPEMLELSAVPQESTLPGVIGDVPLVVGRVARIPVLRGEQLIAAKLTTIGANGTGLSYVVPEGRRAMAVKVDKVIGAGGLLRPGVRVDVFVVIGEKASARPSVAAQNVEVLAVEQNVLNVLPTLGARTDETTSADGTLVDQAEPEPRGTVATLALTPVEVERILFAEEAGSIRLTLRAPGDETTIVANDAVFAYSDEFTEGTPSAATSLSFIVPEGLRAMAVAVDKVVGVGGLLRPGDRVDVVAVLEVETIGGGTLLKFARSLLIGQAIEVLAVEQALENQAAGEAAGGEAGTGVEQPPAQPFATVVTLALTPLQMQQVLLAEDQGVIRLGLRPPGESEIVNIPDTAFFSVADTTAAAELFGQSVQSIVDSGG